VINVAGQRLFTGAMEAILASHEDVAETAVVGRSDALKGETPVGFVVLKAATIEDPADLERLRDIFKRRPEFHQAAVR
jgi:propionyl-CoA synthetase